MKRILSSIVSIILCLCMVVSLCPATVFAESAPKYTLKFDNNGKFKILVLADCQDDSNPDQRMITMIGKALDYEKPDLVVFLGDNVVVTTQTAFKTGLKKLMAPLVARNIPYAYVYGNHDDQSALISKSFMHSEYKKVGTCLTYDADPDLTGCGTCNLPVMSSDGSRIAFNLWMIDSNTYTDSSKDYYDNVHQDQLNWYTSKSVELENQAGHKVNSLVFQHIIVPEAYNLLVENPNGGKTYNGKTYELTLNSRASGYLGEFPCPPRDNSGELNTMAARGDVLGIVTGHDHKNSFIGRWNNIDLIQTSGMTYESYGSDEIRGYRTITIDENNTSRYETDVVTYVQEAAGALNPIATGNGIPDEYYYPEGSKFISDVAIGYGTSKKEPAINALTSTGFTAIDKDLNADAGGAYVYMGYKLTDNYTESIKALRFSVSGESGNSSTKTSVINNNNVEFNIVSEGGDGIVDLNKNAGGAYIYTYYTKDCLAGSAIGSISFSDSSAPPANSETAAIFSNVACPAELNAGTSSAPIYCHYSVLSKVDSSALRQAYNLTSGLNASNYTSASYNALQSARSAAKAIIDKLDAEHASTYSQAAINSAASALNSAYASLAHIVTYKDYDGRVLYTEEVIHGRAAAYSGVPSRPDTEQYSYTFRGWNASLASVTNNMTVTAEYDQILKSYTVLFKNENGTVLQTVDVKYGNVPSYTGQTPVKEATDAETYTFAGWFPELSAVTGDRTYTARYTASPRKYAVTFKNYDGQVLQQSEWPYGAVPAYSGAAPVKPEDEYAVYSFAGWSPEVSEVTGEAAYTAQFSPEYKFYTYKFFVDGAEIPELEITQQYGTDVTAPVYTPAEGYDFSGWSDEVPLSMGTENLSFYGTTSPKMITVSFDLNGGTGAAPVTVTAAFGTSVDLPGEGGFANPGFEFKGWAVTAEASEPVSGVIAPAVNVTLYAVWALIPVAHEPELVVPEESDIYVNEEKAEICGIPENTSLRAFEAQLSVNGGYAEIEALGRAVGTGTVINVYDNNGDLFKSYTVIIFGDLDGNGRVNANDVAMARQAVAEGFEDSVYETAANILRPSKRDRFNLADIAALMAAITEEPLDQAELAQIYEEMG